MAAEIDGVRPIFYRQVEGCPMSPTRIDKDRPVQTIPFALDYEANQLLPKPTASDEGAPPNQVVSAHSKQYRLRCCKIDTRSGFPTLSSWVEADNVWPDSLYFALNGEDLEERKKLHHGRYLPIDVTHLIRNGENELKVYVMRTSGDKTPFNFAVAIELVGMQSHDNILKTLRTITAEESLNSIKQSLTAPSSTSDDDDDITMASANVPIKLFDPIAGNRIFNIPVRGESCLHRDPFDLEIYLSQITRPSPDEPSSVDRWRCPICRKDARPKALVRDGFLVEVRKELEKKGLLEEARAIVVEADGTWQVKSEERTGVRSRSLEAEEKRERERMAKKAPPVVIELD